MREEDILEASKLTEIILEEDLVTINLILMEQEEKRHIEAALNRSPSNLMLKFYA